MEEWVTVREAQEKMIADLRASRLRLAEGIVDGFEHSRWTTELLTEARRIVGEG